MNKPDRDLKRAHDNGAMLTAFLNNICDKLHWEKLDTDRKKIPLHLKAKKNTFVGRRGASKSDSAVMGVTLKATLKNNKQYILIEPRYGQDSFRSTYVKILSNDKSDTIITMKEIYKNEDIPGGDIGNCIPRKTINRIL